MSNRTETRILSRIFFRRFLENDLLSPNGDSHETVTVCAAGLVVLGLWSAAGFVLKFASPLVSPFGTLLSALADKFFGLAGSMIVTGLAAVIEWDALDLDARDRAILGPLPIAPPALLRSKLVALGWLVAVFAAGMNALPALVYPPLQADALNIGVMSALQLSTTHVLVSFAACLFGLLSVLVLRETVRLFARTRLFPTVSAVVQFTAVILLTSALLLLVASKIRVTSALDAQSGPVFFSPPAWFVGLYETASARTVEPVVAQGPWRKRQYWSEWEDRQNRARYLGYSPAFRRLSRAAYSALATLAVTYALLLAWNRRRVSVGRRWERRAAWLPGKASRLAEALVVSNPVARAGFFFTVQTVARSAAHRAHLAGYVGAGIALSVVVVSVRGTPPDAAGLPSAASLAVQMLVSFFFVMGIRRIFAAPSELRANWVFRFAWDLDTAAYLRGVSAAVKLGALLPLLLIFGAIQGAMWGPRLGIGHAAIGWLAAACLSEIVLLRFAKLPFTCSYTPPGTFKTRWPLYVLGLMAYAWGLTWIEREVLLSDAGLSILAGSLCLLLAGITLYKRLRPIRLPVVFDDVPEAATQRLGLMPEV